MVKNTFLAEVTSRDKIRAVLYLIIFHINCVFLFFLICILFVLDRPQQYPALPKFKPLLLSFHDLNFYYPFIRT